MALLMPVVTCRDASAYNPPATPLKTIADGRSSAAFVIFVEARAQFWAKKRPLGIEPTPLTTLLQVGVLNQLSWLA